MEGNSIIDNEARTSGSASQMQAALEQHRALMTSLIQRLAPVMLQENEKESGQPREATRSTYHAQVIQVQEANDTLRQVIDRLDI